MIDVARLRKAFGESQTVFAERLGVTQPTVSKWENGKEEPGGPALILLKLLEKESGRVRRPRVAA